MKHLKSILMVLVIAVVAGIVVWQLMWMKEIGNKFRTEQASGGAEYKIDVKKKNNEGHKAETESAGPVGEEAPMPVKESQTQKKQTEVTLREKEQPVENKAATAAKPSGEKTEPQSGKESGKWYEKDINLGKKSQEVRPGNTATEISKDRTMSVTIKGRPGQTTQNPGQTIQKYVPPQSPAAASGTKVGDVTPHPTSTRP